MQFCVTLNLLWELPRPKVLRCLLGTLAFSKSAKLTQFFVLIFLSQHHSDQMSEGSQVSKVTLCVQIPKWQ